MRHDRVTTATNHYLYNGKELNEDLGLDWYDYGARFYDGELGRFGAIDPRAATYSSWSPYHYAANNPIKYVDINGEGWGLLLRAGKIAVKGTKNLVTKGKLDVASEVADIVQDGATLISPSSTPAQRAEAAFNLVSPVSTKELKAAKKSIERVSNQETAKIILKSPSKRKTPKKVTTIVDEDTGKVYTGTNQARKAEDLDQKVQDLLPNESKEKWPCTQCAEVGAVNEAAKDGANLGKNLKVHTNQVDKKTNTFKPVETCKNCKETTRNLDVQSDNY